MIKWLKQLTDAQKLKNKADLSREKLSLLTKEFFSLEKIKRGLPQRILRYIVDDEGEEVLLELGGNKDCGKTLGLGWCVDHNFIVSAPVGGGISSLLKQLANQYPRQYRLKFFDGIDTRHPGVYYRLAQVYEAASRLDRKKLFFNIPGVENWLEFLLLEAVDYNFVVYYNDGPDTPKIDIHFNAEFIEKILETAGESMDMFTRAVFLLDMNNFTGPYISRRLQKIKGFYQRISYNPQPVLEALDHKNARQRGYALEILSHPDVDLEPFKEKIVTLAVSSAKTVRKAASAAITRRKEIFTGTIKNILKQGTDNQRFYGVSLLWLIAGQKEEAFLKSHLEEESSSKVKEAITGVLTEPRLGENQEPGSDPLQLPPTGEIATLSPLPREVFDALEKFASQHNQVIEKEKQKYKNNKYYKPFVISTASVHKVFKLLQEMKVKKNELKPSWPISRGDQVMKLVKAFLEQPGLELIHVIRFLIAVNFLHYNTDYSMLGMAGLFEEMLFYYRRVRGETFGLREIAAAFKAIGIKPDVVGWSCIDNWFGKPAFMWDRDSLWPFFAENLYLLEEVFDMRPLQRKIIDYGRSHLRRNSFIILTQFPAIPGNFFAWLWEIALGTAKTERGFARECLEKVPGIETRIIQALKSGRQEERAVAADWLAKLKTAKAIPHLQTILKKEKSDLAKGAMMEALETLGVPVEEFLNRKSLGKEAAAVLKKGIPAQLSWFPFEVMPIVHWEDNSEVVDPDILKWLLLLGYKLKSPEPLVVMRKYCSYMNPGERAAFGKYVLEAWITHDTLPRYTYEQAAPEAKKQAKQIARWYPDKKAEDFYQQCLNTLLNECKGSAVKEKGILAVAAACCNADCVSTVQGYLKRWYGIRAAQSKALVQMLAWVDHPLATQLLLSVANRFRTKSIREEAEKSVKKMADHRGWTMDELADRTIPSGGFEKTGKMELEYGSRTFTCRLDENFKISISNETGKVVKSLPNAAKADDPDKVKAAKQNLSLAKKTVKSVLKLQKERLYESMCTQRQWKYRDLKDYLFTHPIVSRYCRQLVWVKKENSSIITFRPLDDGSLTDHRDNEVILEETAVVRLAHSCNTDEKTGAAWPVHFRDYGVTPLFTQFRQERYILKEEDKNLTEIVEFQGYMLDNFTLRGMATKLGYTRGEAEDGGFFYNYTKRFPGLGIESVLEFSGSPMPEENNRVALLSLYFLEINQGTPDTYMSTKLPLGQAPPVLLSETWNDMKQIALSGSGYDKEWEKKLTY